MPNPPKEQLPDDSVPLAKDTIITEEFVPVTSFIHTMKVERARHKFSSAKETEGQYPNAYFNEVASRDSTTAFSVKNVFGIALLEGFNKVCQSRTDSPIYRINSAAMS